MVEDEWAPVSVEAARPASWVEEVVSLAPKEKEDVDSRPRPSTEKRISVQLPSPDE